MDKNNDIQVNKISKWKEAPDSIKDLHYALSEIFDEPSIIMDLEEAGNKDYTLSKLLSRVLDDYNELEAKYQEACGMISQYEEENCRLREQRKRLKFARIKLADYNDRLRRECDRHIDLLDKLRWALEDRGILVEWNEAELEWRLHSKDELIDELKQHYEEELRIREKEKDVKDELIDDLSDEVDDLKADIRDLEVQVSVNASKASAYESEIKQIIELAKSYGLAIYDDRKDAMPDDAKNIGMCGHYYVLGGRNNDELKQHYEDELRIRCEEIDGKNKLIDELKQKIEELESENKSLDFKYHMIKTIGYGRHIIPLKEKIQTLEKENKDLKDALEKDGEFGNNVGKRIADSIREGCNKGVYKLHPLTRIDIHVEETNDMLMIFDRHAIPRISVIFNNTQTEMERDTAQHECEELNEKINSLWRVIEDLNRKIKELEKENKDLKKRCISNA